jgi:hypothetical protein
MLSLEGGGKVLSSTAFNKLMCGPKGSAMGMTMGMTITLQMVAQQENMHQQMCKHLMMNQVR